MLELNEVQMFCHLYCLLEMHRKINYYALWNVVCPTRSEWEHRNTTRYKGIKSLGRNTHPVLLLMSRDAHPVLLFPNFWNP